MRILEVPTPITAIVVLIYILHELYDLLHGIPSGWVGSEMSELIHVHYYD